MPKISVIIPIYNAHKYLKQCLESVINQTLKDIEIICADDGSTDNSYKILQEYAQKDSRIKIIKQKNLHAGIARNNGLKIATGEFVHFLDADDWLDLTAYEKMYNLIKEKDVKMLEFNYWGFNEQTQSISKHLYDNENYSKEFWNRYIDINKNCKDFTKLSRTLWTALFNRDFLITNNIVCDNAKCGNDETFFIKSIIAAKKIYVTDEKYVYYRFNNTKSLVGIRAYHFETQIKSCNTVSDIIKKEPKEIQTILNEAQQWGVYWWYQQHLANENLPDYYKIKNAVLFRIWLNSLEELPKFEDNETVLSDLLNLGLYKFFIYNLMHTKLYKFCSKIFNISKKREHKIITVLGFKISIKQKQKKKILKKPQEHLSYFCIHLVGECNLKCKGCDHFAPLANGEYLSLEDFERDFKRLSDITKGNVARIGLMGGEPLLHPEVEKFFSAARKYFPDATIQLVTNGILLLSKKEEFWIEAKKHNIRIVITKYPIKTNYEKIEQTADKYGVNFAYYYNTGEVLKTSYKIPINPKGTEDETKSFINCFHSNFLCFLSQGKMYTCTIAPNIYRFNKAFGYNIPTENNGIDIYKVKTEKELLEFLAKPTPMCKYCAVSDREFNLPWERSKKDISEWIVTK